MLRFMPLRGTLGQARASRVRGASALACGVLVIACVQRFDGNGVLVEEARAARDFERVMANGGLDLTVSEGEFAVTVRIDENLQPYVRTSVQGGTLRVSVDDGNIGDKLPGPHVLISMPALRDAETAGPGGVSAEGFVSEGPVSLELTGSGRLRWSGSAGALDAVLAGSGELAIEGSAESAVLLLRGSGALDARDLTASGARIEVDGSGNVSATVNGSVDARVEGSGTVDLYGRVIAGEFEPPDEDVISVH